MLEDWNLSLHLTICDSDRGMNIAYEALQRELCERANQAAWEKTTLD